MELLAVVWGVEHFENYVYGVNFGVVSDHKALQSVVKANIGNITFSSWLTRWVDRLLPFDFSVTHEPGRTLGVADYLSRHPSEYESSSVKAEAMFNSWFTMNVVDEIVPSLKRKVTNENGPIAAEKRYERKQSVKESVLTVHTFTQSSAIRKHLLKSPISTKKSNEFHPIIKLVKFMCKQISKMTAQYRKSFA